jgi:Holliday junction resolvasome RuvABC endonuclease subunit
MTNHERLPTLRPIPSLDEIKAKPYPRVKKSGQPVCLALDLSTSCVGWALGNKKEIFQYGKFVFSDRPIGDKLMALYSALCQLLAIFKPDRVYVERPMARRGNTTALHNQVLGIVRLATLQITGQEILDGHIISPITVKRRLGVQKGRDHDHNKLIMVNYVNNALNIKLKFHPGSKLQSQDDIADAIAILLAVVRVE